MTQFVKFEEYNDNEGEDWNFYLQLDGNEEELKRLEDILNTIEGGGECYYKLNLAPLEESEIDTLVKHGGSGYMPYHNKVTGKFTCPEIDMEPWEYEIPDSAWEFLDDNFYKGDICRHFKEDK